MKYNIAAVSFLNAVPIIEQLSHLPADRVNLVRALPSRLSGLLESGASEVALLPVVEVFRGRAAGIIWGTGIACRGAVDSVKFFYAGPLGELKRVLSDRGSRSSAALLEVLLQEMHGLSPDFEEIEPIPGHLPDHGEGVLVIGDRCFQYEACLRAAGETGVASLDLGQAWWDLVGLPFVFAAWAVSAEFLAGATEVAIAELRGLLNGARDFGLQHLDELALREARQGRGGKNGEATQSAVAYYFRESLQYGLGPEELAGMTRFHEMCVQHGIVAPGMANILI